VPSNFPFVLDSKGRISIPKEIREQIGLMSGAQLGISNWAGLIILYREDKDLDAFDAFARFGQLLREKGYDTSEKIDQLVKEIKRETTEDWLRRCLPDLGGFQTRFRKPTDQIIKATWAAEVLLETSEVLRVPRKTFKEGG